jgi:hypothetical protein
MMIHRYFFHSLREAERIALFLEPYYNISGLEKGYNAYVNFLGLDSGTDGRT